MSEVKNNIHPFYGGVFSQWYPCKFTIESVVYNCTEQYMMAQKAALFGDEVRLKNILGSDDPRCQKSQGRLVQGFDKDAWDAVSKDVVFRANMSKFSQNKDLYKMLLETGNDKLVEASPTDGLWGVKLSADDPRIYNPAQWQGSNWLGYILMEVRRNLRDAMECSCQIGD